MIEFLWPYAALFLPLPILVYLLVPKAEYKEPALQVPFFATASSYDTTSTGAGTRSIIRRLMLLLIWIALVAAATRPQWIGEPINLPTSGRDLLLAVDISGSMGTEDMKLKGNMTTRLAVVKDVVGDFVERRKGDRLGLILFGTRAYLQTPLTFDRKTVRTLLTETPLGIAGGKTAIGDAIGLAVKRLQSRPAENRVLILLTDGVNNVGEVDPTQAAKLAAQEGIRIYTIGFGADEMTVPGFFFNRTVNPSAELDVETLTQIASTTGGIFQRARSSEELTEIYEALDKMEPIEQDAETYRPVRSLYWYPLAFALISSLLFTGLHPVMTTWLYGLWAGRPWATTREAAAS
ncbi:MAG: VWA domain-containing protein [Gammaproteobacteria bacterium]|jgi:Ca-activated chloride channel homolog|nr:VWA domain-containing protein [Gammaproteobacteria bacterium]MBT4495097.1 VWA domain-containing protein [Gammaproteobacteria bacterium]